MMPKNLKMQELSQGNILKKSHLYQGVLLFNASERKLLLSFKVYNIDLHGGHNDYRNYKEQNR